MRFEQPLPAPFYENCVVRIAPDSKQGMLVTDTIYRGNVEIEFYEDVVGDVTVYVPWDQVEFVR
jgi:hypothetical protein